MNWPIYRSFHRSFPRSFPRSLIVSKMKFLSRKQGKIFRLRLSV